MATKTTRKASAKPARKPAAKAAKTTSARAKATPKAPAKQPVTKPVRARQAPVSAPTPAPAAAHTLREDSKGGQVLKLLGEQTGASLNTLMLATGWQAHTVRGFISGTVRGKLKLNVVSERIDGERVYRIAA